MHWQFTQAPKNSVSANELVELAISPRAKSIGDFTVRRALPATARQRIGPFIFFDQMGPVTFRPGQAMDVRPHPHIGLSTITWLFEGEIRHQDSLGYDRIIRPGEVNWMTAGKGIVHSERSPEHTRTNPGATLAGIQAWMALPTEQEEMEPAFHHYSADQLPSLEHNGFKITLIAGNAFGQTSPVVTQSDTFYAELQMQEGATFVFPPGIEERGIYVYQGRISIAGRVFEAGSLVVLKPALAIAITATPSSLCMLLGGAGLPGERYLYWNFVSSRKHRIEQAKQDWLENRFPPVPGDHEFIPLPEP